MISHRHRCIFVHIPKNAGQSVEHVFLGLEGLTWESRGRLLLRPNPDPKLGPPRLAHLSAWQYTSCGHVSPEQFAAYYKFAFVRNPWDRVVSFYKYLGYSKWCSFRTFVLRHLVGSEWVKRRWFMAPQCEYLIDPDGMTLVDFVGRFERLESDFSKVCEALSIPAVPLPHVNRSLSRQETRVGAWSWKSLALNARDGLLGWNHERNTRGKRYQDYYDTVTQEVVGRLYADDAQAFGYTFTG